MPNFSDNIYNIDMCAGFKGSFERAEQVNMIYVS